MLKTIVGVLIIIWLAGFLLRVVGDAIHIVLVIAVVVLLLDLLGFGRKSD
jgi:hypothetical protein